VAAAQRSLDAKVVIVDEDDAVLQFRNGDPARADAGTWWFMPGGGLEHGESFEEAARWHDRSPTCVLGSTRRERIMANYSRWEDIEKQRPEPTDDTRAGAEQDFSMGQLIYDLRAEAKLSRRELAERMGTTQSVISRLEEGGGARNRLDTLARVATALDRHLIVSFSEVVPKRLKDAVQVAVHVA